MGNQGKKTKPKKSKHNNIVDWLFDRLYKRNKYSYQEKHIQYGIYIGLEFYRGEVDVLTYNEKTDRYHFYEVKTNFSKKNFKKAKDQFKKYCLSHPEQKVAGIFISSQVILRMHLNRELSDRI